ARERVEPIELPLRFHVDRANAEIDGLRELRRGLADPGEDDLHWNEAGAQREVDLAPRVRVRVAAQPPQEPRDGERRVGFQRVMNSMRVDVESLIDGAVPRD